MMLRIEPYKLLSRGAKALSHRTGILRATTAQVQRHGSFSTLLNWGNSTRRFDCDYINTPEAVAIASNKLRSAEQFRDHSIPSASFTTDRSRANTWLRQNGVLARTLLRGSGGRGIIYYAPSEETDGTVPQSGTSTPSHRYDIGQRGDRRELIVAPMYSKYIKKATEYRVHVFDGQVIDVQQKRKRQEVPNNEVDYRIRNSTNGWVYCRDGVSCPSAVLLAAVTAVAALRLDFGAVDVGWNNHSGAPCVYEVNTAPGLEGTTLDRYFEAIRRRLPAISSGAYKRRRQ